MTRPLLQCQNAIRSDLGLEFASQQACLMISFIVSSSPLLGGSFLLVMEKDCCPWIKSWAWKTKGWLRTARLFSLHTTSSFAVLADSRKNSGRGQILKGLQGKEHHAVLKISWWGFYGLKQFWSLLWDELNENLCSKIICQTLLVWLILSLRHG